MHGENLPRSWSHAPADTRPVEKQPLDSIVGSWTPSPSIAQEIAEAIYRAIVQGELPPDTPLSEADLARRFGVSRTPIREALRRLAGEGIVRLNRGRKPTVVNHSPKEIIDEYRVRAALFSLAARLAAERASDRDLQELEDRLASLHTVADTNDVDTFFWGQVGFYDHLVNVADNAAIKHVLRSRAHLVVRTRLLSFQQPDEIRRTLVANRKLVDALRRRDADAAEAAVRDVLFEALDKVAPSLGGEATGQ